MGGGEIDLHGLTVAEALSRLTAHYNARLRAGDAGPIRVIHGYGSSGRGGDLRTAIRELLSRHAGRLEFVADLAKRPTDEEFTEFHPGLLAD